MNNFNSNDTVPSIDPLTVPVTVVLVDPTSPDGESGLGALTAADTHVVVVTLLTGRASYALREFANHEDLGLWEAGSLYLDQVAERIQAPGRTVGTFVADGPDPAAELTAFHAVSDVNRFVLPASVLRHDRRVAKRLSLNVSVDVNVTEMATV